MKNNLQKITAGVFAKYFI